MSDINCPYCENPQEINHDDGYGYDEDRLHQQQCSDCDKYFTYTTSIHFSYEAFKADCLNGDKHNYKATNTYPKQFTRMKCSECNHVRTPTEAEMKQIMLQE